MKVMGMRQGHSSLTWDFSRLSLGLAPSWFKRKVTSVRYEDVCSSTRSTLFPWSEWEDRGRGGEGERNRLPLRVARGHAVLNAPCLETLSCRTHLRTRQPSSGNWSTCKHMTGGRACFAQHSLPRAHSRCSINKCRGCCIRPCSAGCFISLIAVAVMALGVGYDAEAAHKGSAPMSPKGSPLFVGPSSLFVRNGLGEEMMERLLELVQNWGQVPSASS